MVLADWGLERDESSFARHEHDHCKPVDSDDPADLPQAQAARAHGYEPAHEAPMWSFLPAIWPDAARAWIRDLRIRHMRGSCEGEPVRRTPWSAADYAEIEADTNEMLRACGLPPRPAGRVWLLRPPPDFADLETTLAYLSRSASCAGLDVMMTSAFVTHVQRELAALFGSR